MVAISTLAFAVGTLAVLGVVAYDGDSGDSAPAAEDGTAASVPASCAEGDAACAAKDAIRTAERLAAGTLHAAADGAVVAAGLADVVVDVAADIGRDAVHDVRQSQSGPHSPLDSSSACMCRAPGAGTVGMFLPS